MKASFAAASCFAERIKVNAITCEIRDGRRLFIKRRRPTARLTLACANRFFRLAGNPVRALTDLAEWQRWELECFRRLHGTRWQVEAIDARAVAAEAFPGRSLAFALDEKSLTPVMAAAAGRELRRCHRASCPAFADRWSHGDPHAGNFIYDPAEDRARLIDFEVMHLPTLSAAERHADDLLVFLQDVVGRVAHEAWLPLARAFLAAYDQPEIVAHLRTRLIVPRGLPRLWWAIRTTYLPGAELAHRLELLREALTEREVTA